MRIYCLLDRKLREFGALMQAQNDEVITRLLRDTLPAGSLPAVHPEDLICTVSVRCRSRRV